MMTRPIEERLLGSQPSVPAVFRDAFGEPEPGLESAYRFLHRDRPIWRSQQCRLCGDLLTVVDVAGVCRQCRLEGRTA